MRFFKKQVSFSYPFLLMFGVVFLLNLNFSVLRSVRNTLAVVDLGKGAHTIPFFELFGALPGAILLTWGLTCLLKRFSILKTFLITITAFVSFFLLFAFGLYPALRLWKEVGPSNPSLFTGIAALSSMVFYVIAELWKPAFLLILFWGLVNQYTPLDEAKKLYAPLMLGCSLGTICAGPVISYATAFSQGWGNALSLMMCLLCGSSLVTSLFFYRIHASLSKGPRVCDVPSENPTQPFSFKDCLSICWQTPALRLMAGIVVADYIAYSLGEVIFLDLLKRRCPLPTDYCNYMGKLSTWSGIATVISALVLAPYILRKCRWVVAALATPVCLLVTEGAFFIFLRAQGVSQTWFGWSEVQWLGVAITLGSLQYCLCRATKYTLFDSSKELAFIAMPAVARLKGKLIIDGICARFGRGSASILSISFITLCGGVIASSLLTGIIAMFIAFGWLVSTFRLAKSIEKEPVPLQPVYENL